MYLYKTRTRRVSNMQHSFSNFSKHQMNLKQNIDKIGSFLAEKYLLEIKRENMPQVNSDMTQDILTVFKENGVLVTREKVECDSLHPTQENYSSEKVDDIVEKLKANKTCLPLFVSEDYHILDGHHRWLGGKKIQDNSNGKVVKLPIIRIQLPKNKALVQLIDACNKVDEETDSLKHAVIYPGSFPPFHKGDYSEYCKLKDRFGSNNVYIVASNKTSPRQPLTFSDKQEVITKMYPIPKSMVCEVENVYNPVEIFDDLDVSNTVVVLALTETQISKLEENDNLKRSFKEYKSVDLETFDSGTCYYHQVTPQDHVSVFLSGEDGISLDRSHIIEAFANKQLSDASKKTLFKEIFDGWNQDIFEILVEKFNVSNVLGGKMIQDMINAGIVDIKECQQVVLGKFQSLFESTQTQAVGADDGPATWWETQDEFQKQNAKLAERMGFEVIDQIGTKTPDSLKTDVLPYASFYPIGNNSQSPVQNPDSVYYPYVRSLARMLGFQIIDYLHDK